MRMMRLATCLLMTTLLSGCFGLWQEQPPRSEGRASALLDRAQAPMRACAAELADGTMPTARASCAPLIVTVSCWTRDCTGD